MVFAVYCPFGYSMESDSSEIISKRDVWSKTYQNPSGTYTAEISSEPMHYLDEKGDWNNINTAIIPVDDSYMFDYKNETNLWKVLFCKDRSNLWIDTETGFEMTDNFASIGYVSPGSDEIKVLELIDFIEETLCDGNKLTRKNVFPFVDVTYEIGPGLVRQEIIFTDIAALLEHFNLVSGGKIIIRKEYCPTQKAGDERLPEYLLDNKTALPREEKTIITAPVVLRSLLDNSEVQFFPATAFNGQNNLLKTVVGPAVYTLHYEIEIDLAHVEKNTLSIFKDIRLATYDTGISVQKTAVVPGGTVNISYSSGGIWECI